MIKNPNGRMAIAHAPHKASEVEKTAGATSQTRVKTVRKSGNNSRVESGCIDSKGVKPSFTSHAGLVDLLCKHTEPRFRLPSSRKVFVGGTFDRASTEAFMKVSSTDKFNVFTILQSRRGAVRVGFDDSAEASVGEFSKLAQVASRDTLYTRQPPKAQFGNFLANRRLITVETARITNVGING